MCPPAGAPRCYSRAAKACLDLARPGPAPSRAAAHGLFARPRKDIFSWSSSAAHGPFARLRRKHRSRPRTAGPAKTLSHVSHGAPGLRTASTPRPHRPARPAAPRHTVCPARQHGAAVSRAVVLRLRDPGPVPRRTSLTRLVTAASAARSSREACVGRGSRGATGPRHESRAASPPRAPGACIGSRTRVRLGPPVR